MLQNFLKWGLEWLTSRYPDGVPVIPMLTHMGLPPALWNRLPYSSVPFPLLFYIFIIIFIIIMSLITCKLVAEIL